MTLPPGLANLPAGSVARLDVGDPPDLAVLRSWLAELDPSVEAVFVALAYPLEHGAAVGQVLAEWMRERPAGERAGGFEVRS